MKCFRSLPWTCPPTKVEELLKSSTSPKCMFFTLDFCVIPDMNEYRLCVFVTCVFGKFIFLSQFSCNVI